MVVYRGNRAANHVVRNWVPSNRVICGVVREAEVGAKKQSKPQACTHRLCHATAAPYSGFLNQSVQIWHAVQLLLTTALVLGRYHWIAKSICCILDQLHLVARARNPLYYSCAGVVHCIERVWKTV